MKTAALWGLVAIGLFGVAKVSYLEIIGAANCPHIAGMPICYIVTIGYSLMMLALLLSIMKDRISQPVFLSGWGITFLIALMGTSLEVANGDICPRGFGGIPLCYISLAFCLLIINLFIWIARPATER